jgi:hypothetical protein
MAVVQLSTQSPAIPNGPGGQGSALFLRTPSGSDRAKPATYFGSINEPLAKFVPNPGLFGGVLFKDLASSTSTFKVRACTRGGAPPAAAQAGGALPPAWPCSGLSNQPTRACCTASETPARRTQAFWDFYKLPQAPTAASTQTTGLKLYLWSPSTGKGTTIVAEWNYFSQGQGALPPTNQWVNPAVGTLSIGLNSTNGRLIPGNSLPLGTWGW